MLVDGPLYLKYLIELPVLLHMKKQTALILIPVVIIVALLGWKLIGSNFSTLGGADAVQAKPDVDAIDVTMELYTPWLAALQATSTEFNKAELLATMPLTPELRTKLTQAYAAESVVIDPIICQTALPERIGVKQIFETDTEAQVSVVARGVKVPEQAVVTLMVQDAKWLISDITCSQGENAPEREFSFEREGNILKQSLQAPLDASQWHLIYEKDGVPGYAIPLLFDETSVCVAADGTEQLCVPDQLSEATAVSIKGAMQEAGALVKRMELK